MYLPACSFPLFPLDKAFPGLGGYFVDSTGNVWSTRVSTSPRRMTGSGPSSLPQNKCFTLNGRSYRGSDLMRSARNHKDWGLEMASKADPVDVAVSSNTKSLKRSHAQSVASGLTARGVIIGRVAQVDGQSALVFGSKPAIHLTTESYEDEMKRLALEHPGVEYVALKVVKTVKAGGLTWG